MAEFPALPFWTDSYLADTRHLSTLEHGAYLLLLMEAWRRPTCSLPDDDKMLARLAGLSVHEWYEIKPTIMAFFTRDGRSKTMHQKRLTKERDFVARKSASQRDKVAKRWNKTKKDDTAVIPERYRDDTPTPTPISSSLRSEDIDAADANARACETPPQPPEGNGPPAFRERILAAMGLGPDGIAGPSKFIGNRADMAEAERWMALPGITEDIAVEEVARCMAARQGAPPSKFRYFTPGMRALSAALTAQPLEPDTSGRTNHPPKSDRRRRDDEQRRFDAAINQLADGLAQGTVHIDLADRDPFAFAAGKNATPG